MMPKAWRRDRLMYLIISNSRDGQLLTKFMSRFGIRSIAGSKHRRDVWAADSILRTLRNGQCIGITPDGSRGPRMRVTKGIVELARKSGAPLVPMTFSCTRGKALGTWDRFLLPWPFTRGVFIWGTPIYIDRYADEAAVEATRIRLENALNEITEEADRSMGRSCVRPA